MRQPLQHGAALALEELVRLFDQFAIVALRDQTHARGGASFNLIEHAGPGSGLIDIV